MLGPLSRNRDQRVLPNTARSSISLAALCAGAALFVGAESANAQPVAGAPPVFSTVDENGVNLTSGTFNLSMQDVSIGQVGNGGLAFTRTWFGTGWRYNHIGTINSSGSVYTVSIGGSSETFTLSSGTYASDQGMGSTLTVSSNVYTYTLRDGTVALFDTSLAGGGMSFDANVARLIQITAPNGERAIYTYKSVTVQSVAARRLQSVTNNLGYQLHFDYENDNPTVSGDLPAWKTLTNVAAINNAVDYCDPTADNCTSMTVTWPSVTYDFDAPHEEITDALGRETRITYDGSNRISAIRRPTSTTSDHTTITYNGSGRVSGVSNGTASWTYTYTVLGNAVTNTMTAPGNMDRVALTNLEGRLTSTTMGGITTTFGFDSFDRLTGITHFDEGNTTNFTYDARGNVTQTTQQDKPGAGLSDIVTTATFPANCNAPITAVTCNQPTSITDENGNATDFTYSTTHGGVLTITLPDPDGGGSAPRPQTRLAYTSLSAYYFQGGGSVAAAPTPVTLLTEVAACATLSDDDCDAGSDETITTISYGSNGVANNRLPVSTSSGSGNGTLTATVGLTYDNIGNLLTTDGPLAGTDDTTRYRYDAARQTIGVVGPDPDGASARNHPAVRVTYNLDGQTTMVERGTVTSQSDPAWAAFSSLQQENTTYNFIGLPTLNTLTASGTTFSATQVSFDAANRLECTAVRMNPAVFGSLPGSACTLGTQGSNGPDRITKITLNDANLITQVTQGFGTANAINDWSATYTPNGLIATLTDAGGNVLTYEYDGLDRVSKIRFPNTSGGGSSTTDFEQYTYDTTGNPSNRLVQDRRRSSDTISYTYDNLNRVTLVNASDATPDISYTYDNFSRTLTASAASRTLTYSYDQLSRVLSEAQPQGTVSYQWDLAGRRTQLTYPGGLDIQYDYDLANLVTAIREEAVTTLVSYSYDALLRRTGVTRNPSGTSTTETATFNGASRLTQLVQNLAGSGDDLTLDFTHDPAGGILSRDVSNSAYEWSPLSPASTAYADNGLNQYASVGGTGQSYDTRGNLTTGSYGYDLFNRLVSGPSSSTLSYDPSGRLYETVGGGATTRFLYDGAQIIGEYNGSNVLQRRFVPGPALDEPVVWYEGVDTNTRRWFAADERGSIAAVINSSGAAITRNTYDEYGLRGGANGGRFQFTGQPWLPEASLYHYRARAYSPTLGRFMQTDPILHAGGMNLYAYVGNNPVNFSDPFGLDVNDPGFDVCGNCSGRGIRYFPTIRSWIGGFADDEGTTVDANGEEIVVIGRRRKLTSSSKLPPPPQNWGFPEYGQPGYSCGVGYFYCLEHVYQTQADNPLTPLNTQACRAASSLCLGQARRVYSTTGAIGRVQFPYGTGDVSMYSDRYDYYEQFNHGPNTPSANDNYPW